MSDIDINLAEYENQRRKERQKLRERGEFLKKVAAEVKALLIQKNLTVGEVEIIFQFLKNKFDDIKYS